MQISERDLQLVALNNLLLTRKLDFWYFNFMSKFYKSKITLGRAGEIAQWSGTFVAIPEDPVHASNNSHCLVTTVPARSDILFFLLSEK